MDGLQFNEKDSEKVVEFLNFIATKATFDKLSIKEIIQFYGLLSFCQRDLLKKIEANILEVKSLKQLEKEPIKRKLNKKDKVGS